MQTERFCGHAPRAKELSRELLSSGPCLGCPGCRGICAALIEALSVPEVVLNRGGS
ncbi:hypothetical protein [Ponticoccus sp. (in: a-proteobacteria)]|uniref:hypothetical protein n=1 Tax=Ponticoccus sp. (in: a-proteobacteria) TaxID=1925025 RepID=UPI003AB8CD88